MAKISFFTILIFFQIINNTLFSAMLDIESTRMKSTAGSGVGSFYAEEATLLNPAPLSFFKVSSLYFQKSGGDVTDNDDGTNDLETKNIGFIASDSKQGVSGSISYFKNEAQELYKKQFATSLSTPVGKKSSFGATYRATSEKLNHYDPDRSYKQSVFGVTHLLNNSFNLGIVVVDPFKANPEDTKAIVGIQYTFEEFLTLMIDLGGDYNNNLSESSSASAALQLRVFNDFFIRFGAYEDKQKKENGTGVGAAWVGPKLTFNVAIKNYDTKKETPKTNISDTSFSMSLRF